MVESVTKGNSHPWHFHKLVHILASYRRFYEHLRQQGFFVHLVRARTYVSDFANSAEPRPGSHHRDASEGICH